MCPIKDSVFDTSHFLETISKFLTDMSNINSFTSLLVLASSYSEGWCCLYSNFNINFNILSMSSEALKGILKCRGFKITLVYWPHLEKPSEVGF